MSAMACSILMSVCMCVCMEHMWGKDSAVAVEHDRSCVYFVKHSTATTHALFTDDITVHYVCYSRSVLLVLDHIQHVMSLVGLQEITNISCIKTSHTHTCTHTHSCWFEGVLFPSYLTYITGFLTLTALVLDLGSMIILKCSDYTVDTPIYLQLVSLLGNLALYFTTILCQFFTPTMQDDDGSDYLLLATGTLALLCGVYFLVTNGFGKGRIRSALLCQDDPTLKAKLTHYKSKFQSSSSSSSGQTSRSSLHKKLRRSPMKLADEMNINYVDSYLGYPHTNPVPISMLNQVQQARGKRVKGDKRSGEFDNIGYSNSAYRFSDSTTDV